MNSFDKVTESLHKPRYIDFVNMRTGELHRHDQENFEISIPSAGDTIYTKDHASDSVGTRYLVEERIWLNDVLEIRVG